VANGFIELNQHGGTAVTHSLDTSAWHTYRMTVSGSQVKVYVDENPPPVFSVTSSGDGTSAVRFGAQSTAASQDIYFDWILYTAGGAFAPDVESFLTMDFAGRNGNREGTITIREVPFDQSSADLNKIQFSISDNAGNQGSSPAYTVNTSGGPACVPEDLGDLDEDDDVDLFDVLRAVDIVIGRAPPPTDYEQCACDLDEDGDTDLFDVLGIIDLLLGSS